MNGNTLLTLLVLSCDVAVSQTGPPVIGYGNTPPTPIYVAPGQLLTLIVQNVARGITQTVRAPDGADLPTSLSGVLAGYEQVGVAPGLLALTMPVLEINPFSTCGDPVAMTYCTNLAEITVQVPFEAQCQVCDLAHSPGQGFIAVGEGDAGGPEIDVEPFADQVHIVTSCDRFLSTASTGPTNVNGSPAGLFSGLLCKSIVTHFDGSMVSAMNPAQAGEELTALAVGLGQTNPPSVTGQLVAQPAPTQTTFTIDFNFRPNALPSWPSPTGPPPDFAGTASGYAGLYQINFAVPPVPAGTPPCAEQDVTQGNNAFQYNGVHSNLTVSVGGQFSFDGARICVATQ